jgi:hypothetical protein
MSSCSGCGKRTGLQRRVGCHSAKYCSPKCLKADLQSKKRKIERSLRKAAEKLRRGLHESLVKIAPGLDDLRGLYRMANRDMLAEAYGTRY